MGDYSLYQAFEELVKSGIVTCRICNNKLNEKEIESYDHEGGIKVPYSDTLQWVYVHCTKCGYDWSAGKILRRGLQQK